MNRAFVHLVGRTCRGAFPKQQRQGACQALICTPERKEKILHADPSRATPLIGEAVESACAHDLGDARIRFCLVGAGGRLIITAW